MRRTWSTAYRPTAYHAMPAKILDGKALAAQIQDEIRDQVAEFIQEDGIVPCLAAVLVGDNAASEVYIRNKRTACERAGIESRLHRLPQDVSQDELLSLIKRHVHIVATRHLRRCSQQHTRRMPWDDG